MSQAEDIRRLLHQASVIAVVGLSPKPHRDSHRIAASMQELGYRIIPVHPRADEVLGEQAYPDLSSVPHEVHIVNVFRNSEAALEVVQEALTLAPLPQAIWLQSGIYNEEAGELAADAGVPIFMDHCIRVDYALHAK